MNEKLNSQDETPRKMRVFRMAEAPSLSEAGCMEFTDLTPLVRGYFTKLFEEGMGEGENVKVLINVPGFSLAYAWFKRNFPLPLHSHNADCLYYVIAGDLRLGTETIGRGDGFFVPANMPYTYTPGEHGVEILEFRHATHFDIKIKAKTAPFWEKALERVRAEKPAWEQAKPPHLTDLAAKT